MVNELKHESITEPQIYNEEVPFYLDEQYLVFNPQFFILIVFFQDTKIWNASILPAFIIIFTIYFYLYQSSAIIVSTYNLYFDSFKIEYIPFFRKQELYSWFKILLISSTGMSSFTMNRKSMMKAKDSTIFIYLWF